MRKNRTFFSDRDLRGQLRGHFLEGDADITIRDVSMATFCTRCGDSLDMNTVPMTGRLVEECPRCGTSEPVQRFAPTKEQKCIEPQNGSKS